MVIQHRLQKEKDIQDAANKNKQFKEQIKTSASINKNSNIQQKTNEVDTMKKTKQFNKDFAASMRDENYMKSAQLAMSIKGKEKELEQKKQKELVRFKIIH